MEVKTQKFSVHLVGHAKALDLADDISQCFRVFQCFAQPLGCVRETASFHVSLINNRKKT